MKARTCQCPKNYGAYVVASAFILTGQWKFYESVIRTHLSKGQEEEADEKGGSPVDGDGNGRSNGPGVAGEDLVDEEPGDGSWTRGEHHDEQNNEHDGEVANPSTVVLEGEADGEKKTYSRHTEETSQHESFPSSLLNHDEGDDRHEDVHGTHGNGGVQGLVFVKSSALVNFGGEEDDLQ